MKTGYSFVLAGCLFPGGFTTGAGISDWSPAIRVRGAQAGWPKRGFCRRICTITCSVAWPAMMMDLLWTRASTSEHPVATSEATRDPPTPNANATFWRARASNSTWPEIACVAY